MHEGFLWHDGRCHLCLTIPYHMLYIQSVICSKWKSESEEKQFVHKSCTETTLRDRPVFFLKTEQNLPPQYLPSRQWFLLTLLHQSVSLKWIIEVIIKLTYLQQQILVSQIPSPHPNLCFSLVFT